MSVDFNLPTMGGRKPQKYYGWWVVVASAVCLFTAYGFGFYPLTVAFKDIQGEFEVSRGMLSGAIAIFGIITAIGFLFAGRFCDKFGAPRVMRVSVPLVGLGIILVGLTQNVVQLYAAFAIYSVGLSGVSLVPINVLVSMWFGDKRGRAVGLLSAGVSLGGFGGPLVSSFLLTRFGWRPMFWVLGLAAWGLLVPLVVWIMKTPPRATNSGTACVDPSSINTKIRSFSFGASFTLRQALGTSTFWLQSSALFLVSSVWVAVLSHTPNLLRDGGLSPGRAALGLGLASAMGIWAKPLSGFLSDRLSRVGLFLGFVLFQAVGVFLLTRAQGGASAFLALIILGIGGGGAVPLRPLLTSQFFGNLQFGAVFGALELAYALGGAIGPLVAGWVYDQTGSYLMAFFLFLAAYVVAIGSYCIAYYTRPKSKVAVQNP
ncbi:MAG: major facilitator superfamily MFS 1 [Dehalococcoidia bacterium]|nr:major facilitator superfamily MFS 1 [Dehalococcoidia bacterium]